MNSFDWDTLNTYRKDHTAWPPTYPEDFKIFWAGIDDIHGLICALLNSAEHSIVINMFGYDDEEADTIIKQKMMNERIFVQMSLDSTQAAGVHEKQLLDKWPLDTIGTTIAIGTSARHAISHMKILIVDGLYIITGSTNWSLSGEQKQDNQLTIHRDATVAAQTRSVLDVNHAFMLSQMAAKTAKANYTPPASPPGSVQQIGKGGYKLMEEALNEAALLQKAKVTADALVQQAADEAVKILAKATEDAKTLVEQAAVTKQTRTNRTVNTDIQTRVIRLEDRSIRLEDNLDKNTEATHKAIEGIQRIEARQNKSDLNGSAEILRQLAKDLPPLVPNLKLLSKNAPKIDLLVSISSELLDKNKNNQDKLAFFRYLKKITLWNNFTKALLYVVIGALIPILAVVLFHTGQIPNIHP